jgi:hypothetical protein
MGLEPTGLVFGTLVTKPPCWYPAGRLVVLSARNGPTLGQSERLKRTRPSTLHVDFRSWAGRRLEPGGFHRHKAQSVRGLRPRNFSPAHPAKARSESRPGRARWLKKLRKVSRFRPLCATRSG